MIKLKNKFTAIITNKLRPMVFGMACLQLVSCGKSIESSSSSHKEIVTQRELGAPVITNAVIFQLDQTNTAEDIYKSEGSGWITIPSSPIIKAGRPLIILTRIYLNARESGPTIFRAKRMGLFCDYSSVRTISNKTYNHSFKGCREDIDDDGIPDLVSYEPGEEVSIDKGNLIILEVHSSQTTGTVEVHSEIDVDWH